MPGWFAIKLIRRYQKRVRARAGDSSPELVVCAYTIESIARYGLLVGGMKAIQLGRRVRRPSGRMASEDGHD